MSKAAEFIKKHNMDYRDIVIEQEIPRYLEEMQAGLDGKPSSLLMLPTYLKLNDEVEKNKPVVCIDAGGTNLRIAVARFNDGGEFVMSEISRDTIPGAERELSAQEFFDVMAQLIAPFCKYSHNMVLSFAYRTSSTQDIDAEIIDITKEVKVRGARGKLLAKEITSSLERLGIPGVKMIVINDSVASALAGKAEHLNDGFGAYTGTILGTGSNSCYIEETRNIGKLKADNYGLMVVNTEAGSYDKLKRSDIDIAYNKTTEEPGLGIAEKMTSGAYLGALGGFTLACAAQEGVFKTKGIELAEKLTTADISEFLSDGSGLVTEYMVDEEDEANAREILKNIALRAARLAALQMAAMAEKSYKANKRVCMSIEGTTYEKMPFLKEELKSVLTDYTQSRGLDIKLFTIKHAVLKGCAIAGLSR